MDKDLTEELSNLSELLKIPQSEIVKKKLLTSTLTTEAV